MLVGFKCTVSGLTNGFSGLIVSEPMLDSTGENAYVLVLKDNSEFQNVVKVNIKFMTVDHKAILDYIG